MSDDRDKQPPKHPRLSITPRAQTGVPVEVLAREDVTGRYDTLVDENEARFRRDVFRVLRAMSLKIAAGNKVTRDELRASRAERDRRVAAEEKARERRAAMKRYAIRYAPPIITAIAGLITAWRLQ